jgi:hypothetical protein
VVRKAFCINDGHGTVEIVRARRNNVENPTEVMCSFANMNLKITAAEDVNKTAAVEVIRPIKSDIEVTDNEERLAMHDDAVKNVSEVTEKSITGSDGPESVNDKDSARIYTIRHTNAGELECERSCSDGHRC